VLSGGIYNILESPPPLIPYGDRHLTLDPRPGEQTVYESIFVFLSNAATFSGLWISHRAAQMAHDESRANRYLVAGIALTLMGIIGIYLTFELKRTILS
jgi:Na+/melibiose symporter-like transporter